MRSDARRNRDLILAAAEEAFAADGLGVPVDDIARRAGVGTGTLYRHFATKEALFEAVMVEPMLQLAADARAMVDAPRPGQALFDFIMKLGRLSAAKRSLIEALLGAGVDVKETAAGPKAQVQSAFGALLEQAQAAGEVRTDVTIADLFALIMGTCILAVEDAACQERMLSVVCAGLVR